MAKGVTTSYRKLFVRACCFARRYLSGLVFATGATTLYRRLLVIATDETPMVYRRLLVREAAGCLTSYVRLLVRAVFWETAYCRDLVLVVLTCTVYRKLFVIKG